MTRSAALRYALAPACVALAALLHLSPAGPFLHTTGLFLIGILAAAWFGGAGPGFLAAVLGTLALPHLIPISYPLVAGFFDLPRFITFAVTGLAVGWGATRRGRAEAALREVRNELEAKVTERTRAVQASEERYARAMEATEAGHWEWDLVGRQVFHSPRFRELYGVSPDEEFADREAWKARQPVSRAERERQEQALQAAIDDPAKSYDIELSFEVRPGEIRWLRSRGKVFRDADGRPLRIAGATTDITTQKLAQQALQESEQRYERAMEGSDAGHWDWNIVTDEMFVSQRAREMLALPPGPLPARRADLMALVPQHPDDQTRMHELVRAGVRTGIHERDYRVMPRPGELRWLRSRGKVYTDARGAAVRMTGSLTDITERKLAADELRESEARFRSLTELSSDWYWRQDENLRFTYLSNQATQLTGYSGESSLGKTRWEIESMEPLSCSWAEHQAVLAARQPFRDLECRRIGPDGTVRYLSMSGAPVFDEGGRFKGYQGVGRNITDRKRAEEKLRESEARKSAMFETALDCIISIDHSGRVIEFNPAAERTFGYRRAEVMGKELAELIIPPRLRERHRRGLARYLATGEGPILGTRIEMPAVRADGAEFPVELSVTRIPAEGAPLFTAYLRDITERQRAAEELRESEARFRALTELSSDWYWRQDENLRFTYMSDQAGALGGFSLESSIGKRRWELPNLTPASSSWAEHQAVLAAHQPFRDLEICRQMPDGSLTYYSLSGAPIFDEQGRFKGYQGIGRSITERRQAEEELKRLERQLRQAQRLEAMGTLAGGIAHDFNNILGAILGYGEMAMRDAAKGSRLHRDLDSILVAGERGRALVDRVLAFSRSGVGERVAVHVEKVVREAIDLLAAKLPSNVTLHAKLHAGPAAMLGDATQVHQVLMNLATNAIQAMPSGGTLRVSLDALRIEAARAPTIGTLAPGEYLVLQVADTGTGIAPDILDRIFDPFFTTKEVGTGTGLGLSLVHGIVAEVGGAVDVASTVGAGSTFTVYLPRSGDALDSSEKQEPELPRGDGQRVLIVDDEEPLVRLATRTLEELGYAPTGFTSSAAALAAFRADPQRFDAIITDERMPGMSGSALIREVRGIRDRMPIVLMSGYVGGAVAIGAREAGAEEVLKKPLSARDLATSLARVLEP